MTTITATELREILADAFTGAAQALRRAPTVTTVTDVQSTRHWESSGGSRMAFRIEEAAEALGVGRSTMYKLVLSGQLPSILIGKRRLVPVSALDAWLRHETGVG